LLDEKKRYKRYSEEKKEEKRALQPRSKEEPKLDSKPLTTPKRKRKWLKRTQLDTERDNQATKNNSQMLIFLTDEITMILLEITTMIQYRFPASFCCGNCTKLVTLQVGAEC
jgi:hypothetical protein